MDLINASRYGNIERVKELLSVESGAADVNIQNEYGNTALMCASSHGHLEIVEELLSVESGAADVNIQNEFGFTALMRASCYGHLEIVKELFSVEGIDVNFQNKFGSTALIRATCYGRLEIVKELLSVEGIDVNLQNLDGDTALILASRFGHLEIVKELVKGGGRVDVRALRYTRHNEHTDIVVMLEEWVDDKMLMKLSLQRRCWLTVLINKTEYTRSIPPIISHIHNTIWLEGRTGTVDSSVGTCTSVWARGYVIRMRKKILWI